MRRGADLLSATLFAEELATRFYSAQPYQNGTATIPNSHFSFLCANTTRDPLLLDLRIPLLCSVLGLILRWKGRSGRVDGPVLSGHQYTR